MRILAADTTSAYGSVALVEDGELRSLIGVGPAPHHAEQLIPSIDTLLSGVGLRLSEVDGLAVAAGPGSFTGLRIGIATMEGLAFSTGLPVVGVSALEASAYPIRWRCRWVAAVLKAYRGEIYGTVYQTDDGELSQHVEPVCEPPDRFRDRLPKETVWIVGTGARTHGERWRGELGDHIKIADQAYFLAESVARLAAPALMEGQASERREQVGAYYIRPSEAERNLSKSNDGASRVR